MEEVSFFEPPERLGVSAYVYCNRSNPLQPIYIQIQSGDFYIVVDSHLEKIDPPSDKNGTSELVKESFLSNFTERAISQDRGKKLLISAKQFLQEKQEALKELENMQDEDKDSGDNVPLLSGVANPTATTQPAPEKIWTPVKYVGKSSSELDAYIRDNAVSLLREGFSPKPIKIGHNVGRIFHFDHVSGNYQIAIFPKKGHFLIRGLNDNNREDALRKLIELCLKLEVQVTSDIPLDKANEIKRAVAVAHLAAAREKRNATMDRVVGKPTASDTIKAESSRGIYGKRSDEESSSDEGSVNETETKKPGFFRRLFSRKEPPAEKMQLIKKEDAISKSTEEAPPATTRSEQSVFESSDEESETAPSMKSPVTRHFLQMEDLSEIDATSLHDLDFNSPVKKIEATTATVFYNSKTFVSTMIEYRGEYYTPDGNQKVPHREFLQHSTNDTLPFAFSQKPSDADFAENISYAATMRIAAHRETLLPSDFLFHELDEIDFDVFVKDNSQKRDEVVRIDDTTRKMLIAAIPFTPPKSAAEIHAILDDFQTEYFKIEFHDGAMRVYRTGPALSEVQERAIINTALEKVVDLCRELNVVPQTKCKFDKTVHALNIKYFTRLLNNFYQLSLRFEKTNAEEVSGIFSEANIQRTKKHLARLGFEFIRSGPHQGALRNIGTRFAGEDSGNLIEYYPLEETEKQLVCSAPLSAPHDKIEQALNAMVELCFSAEHINHDTVSLSTTHVPIEHIDTKVAFARQKTGLTLHVERITAEAINHFFYGFMKDKRAELERYFREKGFNLVGPEEGIFFLNDAKIPAISIRLDLNNSTLTLMPLDGTTEERKLTAIEAACLPMYDLCRLLSLKPTELVIDEDQDHGQQAIIRAGAMNAAKNINSSRHEKLMANVPFTGKSTDEIYAAGLSAQDEDVLETYGFRVLAPVGGDTFFLDSPECRITFHDGVMEMRRITRPLLDSQEVELINRSTKAMLYMAKKLGLTPTGELNLDQNLTERRMTECRQVFDAFYDEAFAPSRAFGTSVTLPLHTNGIDIATFVNTNRADLTRFFSGFGYTLNGLTLTNRANGNVLDIDPANDTIALRHVTGETDDAKLDKIEDALNAMYEFQRVLTPDADPNNDINDILIETTNEHDSPFHGDHSDAMKTTVILGDGFEDALDIDVRDEVFANDLDTPILTLRFTGRDQSHEGIVIPPDAGYRIVAERQNITLYRTTQPLPRHQEIDTINRGIDQILQICTTHNLQPQAPITHPAGDTYSREVAQHFNNSVRAAAFPKWIDIGFSIANANKAAFEAQLTGLINNNVAGGMQRVDYPLSGTTFCSMPNAVFQVHRDNVNNIYSFKYKILGTADDSTNINALLHLTREAQINPASLNFSLDRNLDVPESQRIQEIYNTERDLVFPRPFEFAIKFKRRVAYPYLHADEITALNALGFENTSDPDDTRQYGHYRFENRARGIVITLEEGELNCTMPRQPIEVPAVPARMNDEINNALEAMFIMGYSLGHNLKLNQNAANPLFDTVANPEKQNLKNRFDATVINIPRPRIFIQFTPKANLTPTAAQLANANARLAPEGISIVYDPNGVSVIRYELNELSESDAIKRMIEISSGLTDEPNSLVITSDHTRQERIEREFNKHRAERYPFAFTFKGQTAGDIARLLTDDENRSALEEKAKTWGFKLVKDGNKYYLQHKDKNSVISLNDIDGRMTCRMKNPPATQEQINEAVKAMMGVAALLHVNPAQLNLEHRLTPEFVDDTRDYFNKMRDQFFPLKTKVDIRPTDPVLNLYTRLDTNLDELNRRLRPLFFKLKKESGLYLLEGQKGETTEGITLGIGDDGAVYLYNIKTQDTITQENQLNQAIEAAALILRSFGIRTDTLHTEVTGLEEGQSERLIGDVIPNAIIYFSRHKDDEEKTVTDYVEYVRINDRWFKNTQTNQSPYPSTIELEEIILPQPAGAPGLPSAGVLANCLKKTCYLNPNNVANIDENVAQALSQTISFATYSKYSNNGRFLRQCIEDRGVREAINTAQARDPDTGFRIQPDGYHLVNEHSKAKVKRNADGSRQSSFIGGYTKDQVTEVAKELLNMIEAQMREDAVLMERFGDRAFPKDITYHVTTENKPHTVEDMKIIRAAIEQVRTDFETLKTKYPAIQDKCKFSNKPRHVKNTEPVIALGAAKRRNRDDADPVEPGISGVVRPRGAR